MSTAPRRNRGNRALVWAGASLILLAILSGVALRLTSTGVADRIDRPNWPGPIGRVVSLLAPPAAGIKVRQSETDSSRQDDHWIGPLGSPAAKHADAAQELHEAAGMIQSLDLARYTLVCMATPSNTPPPCKQLMKLEKELRFCLYNPSRAKSGTKEPQGPAGLPWCTDLSSDTYLLVVFTGKPTPTLGIWRRGCARALCRGR